MTANGNIKTTEGVKTLLGDPKKAILKLSVPMMIAMSVQATYNLVDAMWVSGLGSSALAAVGLFFPFMFFMMAVSAGIGIGGSSAISRRIGEKNKADADNTAIHTLLLCLFVGLLLGPPYLPFLDIMYVSLGAEKDVASLAVLYSRILFAGAPLLVFAQIGSSILRGEGDMKRAMYAMVTGSVLNMALDPIFIYTFGLGIAGAAWATLLSIVTTSTLIGYWLFVKKDTFVEITFRDFRYNPGIMKEILRVGIPSSLSQMSMSVSMLLLTVIVIRAGGTDGLAVFVSGWRIVQMGTIPLLGMAAGVTAVCGAAYGARDWTKLRTAYLYAVRTGVIIELLVAAFVAVFAPQITYIFTYSENSSHLGPDLVVFLRIMSLHYFVVPLGMLTSAMFQGIGYGTRSLTVTILRTVFLTVPCAYIGGIVLGYGLVGVWIGFLAGAILSVSVTFTWGLLTVRSFQRIKK